MPQNIEVESTPDKTLLQIATENNLEIRSICKGVPSCAECRVRIASGENNLIPPSKAELNLIGTSYFIDSRRLSCQVHCFGDVTVDLTEQIERSENQTKKVRGFRVSKSMESKAIQDTMILAEKPEDRPQEANDRAAGGEPTERPERAERGNDRNNNRNNDRQNERPKQERQQQGRQNNNRNNNRGENKQAAGPQASNRSDNRQGGGRSDNRGPRNENKQGPRPDNRNQRPDNRGAQADNRGPRPEAKPEVVAKPNSGDDKK